MKIIGPSTKREVFGWCEITDGGEYWFLSPHAETVNGRRPMNMYNSRDEAVKAANDKGCRITWQTN